MTTNLSNGLAGLSLLSGSSTVASALSTLTVESRAVRTARALFTAPASTPPWSDGTSRSSQSTQLASIKAMKTLIDAPSTSGAATTDDIQTAFITYKALDRLRALADHAAASGASAAERTSLQKTFAKGLTDLRAFLADAPSDKVNLFFAQPARRAQSVAIAPQGPAEISGEGVVAKRTDPLTGIAGDETFRITLSRTGASDTISVDLSGTPQPPTLDSIANAFNRAIQSLPLRNPDGSVVVDSNGNAQPRWLVRFVPDKGPDKWGLKLETMGTERVSLEQMDAGDSLMVATGQTALDAPARTRLLRLDDPQGAMETHSLATLAAVDRIGTEEAQAVDKKAAALGAAMNARALATDAHGYSYIVGTTAGDLQSNLSHGEDDLFLAKLDNQGNRVWQRTLGPAGSVQGAALSVGADGSVTVAGTATGRFDGANSDGDMLVSRFDSNGDESFSTLVRSTGADSADAVLTAPDGTLYVGGKSGAGGAIVRLSANGKVLQRQAIDADVKALAIDPDGNLLALAGTGVRRLDGATGNVLGTIDLGTVDARVMAVGADGSIAVGGARSGDGFVARIDSDLSSATMTDFATTGTDQVDSVAFLDGAIYAGGRTTGSLDGAARRGAVDGFVARVDGTTGVTESVIQFGQTALRTEPVRLAAAPGNDDVLGALGLHRGTLNPIVSQKLVAQTSLRAGDEFALSVDYGAVRKITIAAGETLTTLADKVRAIAGTKAAVTTPSGDGGRTLRIDAKAGHSVELMAGADGRDGLAKLGLAPERLSTPAALPANASSVRPGGNFSLDLTEALDLSTTAGAAAALDRIKSAISMTQTAYRSLYWDSAKAARADASATSGAGTVPARLKAQIGNYQAALDRLTAANGSTGTAAGLFGVSS